MHYFFQKVRWYVGIGLLLCLAVTVMKYSAWIDRTLFGASKQPRTVGQQSMQPGGQQVGPVTQSATSGQAVTARSASANVLTQLSQARSLLDEASTNASEALKEVITWQSDVEPLHDQVLAELTATGGESGEADGASKQFDRLAYVMRRNRTSAQQLRDAVGQIASLRTKVDDLMKQSSPAALSPIEMADISQLHAMCKKAKDDWHRDVKQALAIRHLLETQTVSPDNPAAPTTVGRKIQDADAKAVVEGLDRQIVRDEEDEAAREAREAKEKQDRYLEEQQAADLLAKATSPEVKLLLAPFLEPRTVQPSLSGTFSIRWVHTDEKKPMSFRKLDDLGALDDTTLGRQTLALVAGNRKLPEPKWSVASQPGHWSSEDEERLKQAQEMLRQYGPILVGAGLLSK